MPLFRIGALVSIRHKPYASYRQHAGKRGTVREKQGRDPDAGQAWSVSIEGGGVITLFEDEMELIEVNFPNGRHDPVSGPSYYTSGYSNGAQVIDIVERLPFNRGAAIKYLARAGRKDDEIQDLRKAHWYIERELVRMGASL